MPAFRSFAIVPAAGQSSRMGTPKLLLPWGETTIIESVLDAWKGAQVRATVVVVPPDDRELADLCWHAGAEVVVPSQQPGDMKQSVRIALRHIAKHLRPRETDVWLVAPADMPHLSSPIIARLLEKHRPDEPRILLPTLNGRRGHPALFPWPLAGRVDELGPDEGLNALVQREHPLEIPCDDLAGPDAFGDVDTPEDYGNRPQ